MTKIVLVLIFGLFVLVNRVIADCACSSRSSAACLNETYYDVCLGSIPLGQPKACDAGKVCTNEPGICKTPDGTAANEPACRNECNTCLGTPLAIACVSDIEFVLCDSSGEPMAEVYSCTGKTYCNIASYEASPTLANLCISQCGPNANPTCPVNIILNPAEEFTKSCVGKRDAGAYPNKSDPTCKTYVYCELYLNTMYSYVYSCTGTKGYFDSQLRQCVATKPKNCT